MKKNTICSMLVNALLIGAVFLWPLSFSGLIADDADLFVIYTLVTFKGGQPIHTTTYQFPPDSQELAQIRQILNAYSFCCTLRSFSGDAPMDRNDAGYWLHLYSGENDLSCGGTGEIIVNSRVYRMGCWGNHKAWRKSALYYRSKHS